MKQNGIAYEKDGAIWFSSTSIMMKKMGISKADGSNLFSDIAYHETKLEIRIIF